ncbi:MAG: hypothetical protein JO253_09730, partial [Alphaproteobacteria bacterium]|nr:hypothetical protein [Alphaproteobacteria bacterium]
QIATILRDAHPDFLITNDKSNEAIYHKLSGYARAHFSPYATVGNLSVYRFSGP